MSMTDRELLELATKAAGVRHIEYTNDYDGSFGLVMCNEHGSHGAIWSPLTDDGDALRLAVKLCLRVEYRECGHAYVWKGDLLLWNEFALHETIDHERCAATRRAIARAAAEIGKEMK